MPGVPYSKACDACRKVKKKCDELQPCSRCTRLQLPCAGSGQRRFKFKNTEWRQTKSSSTRADGSKQVVNLPMSQNPTNPLLARFINISGVSDIRFDISYYGEFLKDLPRRFGHSAVLDAAAKALVSSYPYFCGREVPRDVLVLHGKSLRVLRESLDDPVQARSPNTLCAVYLISICQDWISKSEKQYSCHGEAIAHLLRIVDLKKCTGEFEKRLIITASVLVVLERWPKPRLQMTPKFWGDVSALIKQSFPIRQSDNIPRPTISIMSILKFEEYLRNPYPHIADITSAYEKLRDDEYRISKYLDQCGPIDKAGFSSFEVVQLSGYRAAYDVVIALAVVLNNILRAFDPTNATLAGDSAFLCEKTLAEAELAFHYRPLGAAHVIPCLAIALAFAEDPHQMSRIECVLSEYQTYYGEGQWKKLAIWLRAVLQCHRGQGGSLASTNVDPSVFVVPGAFCMMLLKAFGNMVGASVHLDSRLLAPR
ncbi:hypothetical protein N7495_002556 [Penicillium taxi]|uniref:uncharacterized protein n=1 Tax=Penicillium taxi TaxID=168475 RepID=UPI0025456BB9|nr:uncharacterized protein N7495_002556 [Penicillium taxi]KAJ5902028.1 hypothetical protein N7495_002556 [Penicillium taxi]